MSLLHRVKAEFGGFVLLSVREFYLRYYWMYSHGILWRGCILNISASIGLILLGIS